MKQRTVWLLAGPPAAGKSTWAKERLTADSAYISRDEIRFSFLKEQDEYFAYEDSVFKLFVQKIQEAIDAPYLTDIYIDATHLSRKSRFKTLNRLYLNEVDLNCVCFMTPLDVCLARNADRNGRAQVPEDVIKSMYKAYAVPVGEEVEHYNQVIYVGDYQPEELAEPRIFITSDTHFGHNKPFLYEPRGFVSIQEHDEKIIENWNSVVRPQDTVYLLGDVMLVDNTHGMECLKRLNGNIKIIPGNHDSLTRLALYPTLHKVEVLPLAIMLKHKKYYFYLSHYPTMTSNYEEGAGLKGRTLSISGHTHSANKFYNNNPYTYCVCLDAHNCYPVLLDDIIEDMKLFIKEKENASN